MRPYGPPPGAHEGPSEAAASVGSAERLCSTPEYLVIRTRYVQIYNYYSCKLKMVRFTGFFTQAPKNIPKLVARLARRKKVLKSIPGIYSHHRHTGMLTMHQITVSLEYVISGKAVSRSAASSCCCRSLYIVVESGKYVAGKS